MDLPKHWVIVMRLGKGWDLRLRMEKAMERQMPMGLLMLRVRVKVKPMQRVKATGFQRHLEKAMRKGLN